MTESIQDWQEPYEPQNCTNEQLRDDWRLFVAAVANRDGGKSGPEHAHIYQLATACAQEIADRVRAGTMQFTIATQKSDAYQKLWRAVAAWLAAWQIAVLSEEEGEDEGEGEETGDDLQPPAADALREEAAELAPVNPSGVELGEEITREQVLDYFKSFYRTKPYISLVGGLCTQGKTKGDIDIFIRSVHRDLATEFRIIRMFPQELWQRFQFHYPADLESHPGIFTNYMDIYDELIERIENPKLVLMSSTNSKTKKLELFTFQPLLKPAHGHFKGEEYSIEKLIEVVNTRPGWYKAGIYVQRKFDGCHVRCDCAHDNDCNSIIFSEEGNDISAKLPTLVKELQTATADHDIIVTGEIEFWEDDEHRSRQQTTAIIHTKVVHPDEEKVVLNVFDCLYYDKDLHNEPYTKRLECLKLVRETPHIKKADYRLVHSATELKEAVEYYAARPGSEGAYLKRADFPYELDGKTQLNIKYKNTFSIDAKVVAVQQVKKAESWNYLCVIGNENCGEGVPIGRTYNTAIKAEKGDIIKVEFVNLSRYTDPDSGMIWFNWWSPHVIALRSDKKVPDTVNTANKLVEASSGTVKEKEWPRRYANLDGADPCLTYPDESKHWKGMVHCHGRGRSVHLDFRTQIDDQYATGWTLYIPRGLSKTPETFAEFKELVDAEILPLVKATLSNPQKKFNCGKKAPEPIEWLSYSGMVEPGHIGATKNEAGFFYIIDTFEVQFGAQKSYFHEYFCDGKLFNGRVVFRLLENKAEWKKTDEGLMTWMMFIATESPTPYVISERAVEKAWVPPESVSCLPRKVRSKVPQAYQYWHAQEPTKRREIRDELVKQLEKRGATKIIDAILAILDKRFDDTAVPAEFKLLKQTWKGQQVIREGASRTIFYLILKGPDRQNNHIGFALNADPIHNKRVAGLQHKDDNIMDALWKTVGEVPPRSLLNTTKNTPSTISLLDQGRVTFDQSSSTEWVFRFKGAKLTGIWILAKQNDSKLWTFVRIDGTQWP